MYFDNRTGHHYAAGRIMGADALLGGKNTAMTGTHLIS